jgi:hypothetical protein
MSMFESYTNEQLVCAIGWVEDREVLNKAVWETVLRNMDLAVAARAHHARMVAEADAFRDRLLRVSGAIANLGESGSQLVDACRDSRQEARRD